MVASPFPPRYKAGMEASTNTVLSQVIEHLGGVTQVAHTCGVTESAVRHWVRKARVPKTAAYLIQALHPQFEAKDLIG